MEAIFLLANGLLDARQTRQTRQAMGLFASYQVLLAHFEQTDHLARQRLVTRAHITNCQDALGQVAEVLEERRAIYREIQTLPSRVIKPSDIFEAAKQLGDALVSNSRFKEARVFLKPHVDRARRELGPRHYTTIHLTWWYGESIVQDDAINGDDDDAASFDSDLDRELDELPGLLRSTLTHVEQIWGAESSEVRRGAGIRRLETAAFRRSASRPRVDARPIFGASRPRLSRRPAS